MFAFAPHTICVLCHLPGSHCVIEFASLPVYQRIFTGNTCLCLDIRNSKSWCLDKLRKTWKHSTAKQVYIRMSQMITLNVTCWLDRTLRPPHKWSLPFKRHSRCPPVSGGEAQLSIVCVLCLTRWLLGMSHLMGSDCQQEQNVIMSRGCCGPATIIGNSSPQVMMIMDFAANDFGWAVILASSTGSDWNFLSIPQKRGRKLSVSQLVHGTPYGWGIDIV